MPTPSPSFSIFIETSNLEMAAHERLRATLRSIAAQEPPPETAEEVVLLVDGTIDSQLMDELLARHPWLRTRRIEPGIGYGDQKALGAASMSASSEILVFADADCQYEPGWLDATLSTFRDRPDVEAIAGETTIDVQGPYTLATALFFYFPRFSNETEPSRARGMYLNNAAFRRSLLSRIPFPEGLAVRRGQNVLYCRVLENAGVSIWRVPRARSLHSPPEGVRAAVKLLFWTGRDSWRFDALVPTPPGDPWSGDYEPYDRPAGRVGKIRRRFRDLARENRTSLAWLPLALPIACATMASFFAGRATEAVVETWRRRRSADTRDRPTATRATS